MLHLFLKVHKSLLHQTTKVVTTYPMNKSHVIYSAFAFALLIAAGCAAARSSGKPDPPAAASPIASSTITTATPTQSHTPMKVNLVTANNQFGFDLFSKLRQSEKDKNLFFSPISITMALAMTY